MYVNSINDWVFPIPTNPPPPPLVAQKEARPARRQINLCAAFLRNNTGGWRGGNNLGGTDTHEHTTHHYTPYCYHWRLRTCVCARCTKHHLRLLLPHDGEVDCIHSSDEPSADGGFECNKHDYSEVYSAHSAVCVGTDSVSTELFMASY